MLRGSVDVVGGLHVPARDVDSPVMILAGGTGGHVFPGLAVAEELRGRRVPVVWLGGTRGIETRVVPAAGIDLEQIDVAGLRGGGLLRWIAAPLKVGMAAWRAGRVLRQRRPRVVLAFGGFAAGPGGLAAWLLRQSLVVHEQNSRAGLTNRVLARLARRTLCGFPGALPRSEHVGNPVRRAITQEATSTSSSALGRLLVLGGSQGARALNEVLPAAVAAMASEQRPAVRHQTGVEDVETVRKAYADLGVGAEVEPFIEDMPAAYRWADLVVCRAGALTLAELAIARLGAVLIPLPHAADDHQTTNARYHADAGAAILVPQAELEGGRLSKLLSELYQQPERLQAMGAANARLAMPNAARDVADVCLEVAA